MRIPSNEILAMSQVELAGFGLTPDESIRWRCSMQNLIILSIVSAQILERNGTGWTGCTAREPCIGGFV